MLNANVIGLYERINPEPLWDDHFCRQNRVLYHQVGSEYAGVLIKLQIKTNQTNSVTDTRFSVYGDAYAIAAIAYFSEWLLGRSVKTINQFSYEKLTDFLEIPENKTLGSILLMQLIEKFV